MLSQLSVEIHNINKSFEIYSNYIIKNAFQIFGIYACIKHFGDKINHLLV